jgi:cell fate (sporulation/competence/biofilm development) regulator YmcA (YheA/YmcA/DUF963 family)
MKDLRKNINENGKRIQLLMSAIKQALTELHSAKTEAWEITKKEIDSLVYRVEHFPKILAKIDQELSRRNSYNSSIEQLMAILIKVQGQEAHKRKEFNRKYAKNAVFADLTQRLRQTAPVIYFEPGKQSSKAKVAQSQNTEQTSFFKNIESYLQGA